MLFVAPNNHLFNTGLCTLHILVIVICIKHIKNTLVLPLVIFVTLCICGVYDYFYYSDLICNASDHFLYSIKYMIIIGMLLIVITLIAIDIYVISNIIAKNEIDIKRVW